MTNDLRTTGAGHGYRRLVETGSLFAAGVRGSYCLLPAARMRFVVINMTQVTQMLLSGHFSVQVRYCCHSISDSPSLTSKIRLYAGHDMNLDHS